jgi:hypothetical protein
LFLPKAWDHTLVADAADGTADQARAEVVACRQRCGIPDTDHDSPKWMLVVEMLDALAVPIVHGHGSCGWDQVIRQSFGRR